MGFVKEHPSIDMTAEVHSPVSRRPPFGEQPTRLFTRSVLVVPPDSDGLLLQRLHRSVAPCSQSWGSPCFDVLVLDTMCRARQSRTSPLRRYTLRSFSLASSQYASPRLIPSRRCSPWTYRAPLARVRAITSITRPQGLAPLAKPLQNAPPLPVECCTLLPWASRSVVCLVRPVAHRSYGLTVIGQADDCGTSRSP